jgi:hypothetical protein
MTIALYMDVHHILQSFIGVLGSALLYPTYAIIRFLILFRLQNRDQNL